MSIVTYPLNGITYDAEAVSTYLCTRTSGVYNKDTNFSVRVTGSRKITISPGLAWINYDDFCGVSVCSRESVVLTVPDADSSLSRIDRVVLRFDVDANQSEFLLRQGTPADRPAPPAILQNHRQYELGLCTISVPAGSVSVTDANLTDTRMDESVCGVMRDGVTDGNAVTLTAAQITAALGFTPAPAQLPYRVVYDHSYDGKGLSGSDASPVKIVLKGDYDAIALIRTETSAYGDREEITRQRVLLELFTQESGTDSFKSNYIALKGLPETYTTADKVNAGVIVTNGIWNYALIHLKYAARTLSLYHEQNFPQHALNASGYQYHVFGITLDSSILPAAPDYTDIGT